MRTMDGMTPDEILDHYRFYLKERDIADALMEDYYFEDAFEILTGIRLTFFEWDRIIFQLPERAESLKGEKS